MLVEILIVFSIGFIIFVITSVIVYAKRRAQNAANAGYVLSERPGKHSQTNYRT